MTVRLNRTTPILFTEGGDRDKLGRGAIWKGEISECIHQNHVFKARVIGDFVLPEYISLFTKTDVAKKYFFTNATQSTNLSSISMTTLGNTPIALPPIDEQYSVLQRVGEQTVAADALETNYVKAIDEVEELPRIILVKAFTGELTEQNPDDEPGSMLLDQIQAEREVIKNKPKIAKKVRRPKEDKVIMNIVETLKANGGKMKSSDLWLSSSFKENIELFYVALRTEVEVNGKVKETLDRQYVELTEI